MYMHKVHLVDIQMGSIKWLGISIKCNRDASPVLSRTKSNSNLDLTKIVLSCLWYIWETTKRGWGSHKGSESIGIPIRVPKVSEHSRTQEHNS